MKLNTRVTLQILATVLFLSASMIQGLAQGEETHQEIDERAFKLGTLGKRSGKNVRRSDPKVAAAQLQQDFTHIQIVNNDFAEAVSRRGPLDLKFVSTSASDIKECAERLAENLTLPAPEKSKNSSKSEKVTDSKEDDKAPKPDAATETRKDREIPGPDASDGNHTPEQLKRLLTALDNLITEFAHNPVFREATGKDNELATKARNQLREIIDLSSRIKKMSEDLNMPASQH
jgi:hypothetical protein